MADAITLRRLPCCSPSRSSTRGSARRPSRNWRYGCPGPRRGLRPCFLGSAGTPWERVDDRRFLARLDLVDHRATFDGPEVEGMRRGGGAVRELQTGGLEDNLGAEELVLRLLKGVLL